MRCTTYAPQSPGPAVLQRMVVTPPSPLGAETTNFDALGRVADHTDGRGKKTTFTYDDVDRVTQVRYDATTGCDTTSTCNTYAYDDAGNVSQRVDNTGTTTFSYDALGRLTKKATPDTSGHCAGPGGITFAWDGVGNMTSLCDAGGRVSHAYDAANNLCWQLVGTSANACSSPPAGAVTFAYDNDDRRISTTYPTTTAVTMAAQYFPDGTLKSIEATRAGAVLTRRVYAYANGTTDTTLRRKVTNEAGAVTSYGYDASNRLYWVKAGDATGTCRAPAGRGGPLRLRRQRQPHLPDHRGDHHGLLLQPGQPAQLVVHHAHLRRGRQRDQGAERAHRRLQRQGPDLEHHPARGLGAQLHLRRRRLHRAYRGRDHLLHRHAPWHLHQPQRGPEHLLHPRRRRHPGVPAGPWGDPLGPSHFLHDLDDVIDASAAFAEGFGAGAAIGGGIALCSTLASCAAGAPTIAGGLVAANDAFERATEVSKRRQRRGSRH